MLSSTAPTFNSRGRLQDQMGVCQLLQQGVPKSVEELRLDYKLSGFFEHDEQVRFRGLPVSNLLVTVRLKCICGPDVRYT